MYIALFFLFPLIFQASGSKDGAEPVAEASNVADLGKRAQSSIWTAPIKCLREKKQTGDYCVYTDAKFANGRGISFFTTPEIAERIPSLPAYTKKNPHKNANKKENVPWEVREVPGRGRGLFATQTLHRGDPIMENTPLGVYLSEALEPDFHLDYPFMHAAFDQLPKESQDLFLSSMTAQPQGDRIMDRVNMNAFAGEFEGQPHFVMYPESAIFNHDCRPNAMYFHNLKRLVYSTAAARTIEVGEEITIPYINIMQSRTERQAVLGQYWGFQCSCSLCSASDTTIAASDARLAKIIELQNELSDYRSEATPAMAENLISLYAEEGLYAAKAAGHTLASLAYNAVGDTKVAKFHADFALEAGMAHSGTDEDKEQMKLILDNAEAHWSYRVRLRKDEL